MPYFVTILITLLLATPAMSVELFRYRGAGKDGGTLEFVFEASEQNSANAVTKEKAAEIAADFITTFYHVQVGALETQEFRTAAGPVLAGMLFRHDQGMLRQMFFLSCSGLLFFHLANKWRSRGDVVIVDTSIRYEFDRISANLTFHRRAKVLSAERFHIAVAQAIQRQP